MMMVFTYYEDDELLYITSSFLLPRLYFLLNDHTFIINIYKLCVFMVLVTYHTYISQMRYKIRNRMRQVKLDKTFIPSSKNFINKYNFRIR